MNTRRAEGVLLTGVYGAGKSSVAVQIAYLLEQSGEPYALLDLDYLSNDRPIGVVAREVMAFMGWPGAPITP